MNLNKVKQEIEEEIRNETKGKKKHYKSLFNSINEPLSKINISTHKLKIKRNKKNSQKMNRTRRRHEERNTSVEEVNDQKKVEIRKFIKDKRNKNKLKQTIEKNSDFEKH